MDIKDILTRIDVLEEKNAKQASNDRFEPLDLNGKELANDDFLLVIEKLEHCPHIREADFSDNRISRVPRKGFSYLHTVNFKKNPLPVYEVMELVEKKLPAIYADTSEDLEFGESDKALKAVWKKRFGKVMKENRDILKYEGPGQDLSVVKAVLNRNRRYILSVCADGPEWDSFQIHKKAAEFFMKTPLPSCRAEIKMNGKASKNGQSFADWVKKMFGRSREGR